MKIVIAGATGLIGTQLVNHWLSSGHEISVISRSRDKIEKVFQQRVTPIEWKELQPAHFAGTDLVVNLSGAGLADKRWTAEQKQLILTSRIEATSKIATLLAGLGKESPAFFSASAIGVYGLQTQTSGSLSPKMDETTAINVDAPKDFLSKVAGEWEKATLPAKEAGVRVVNMRFGVVLAKSGGALKQMIVPYYFCIGGPIGTGQQAFSWVAIDDVVRALDFLIAHKELSGAVNIVAPGCVAQRDFAKAIGRAIHRPAILPTPAFVLKTVFGDMAEELLLEGQHVYPRKLLEAGFTFSYPDVDSALQHVLQ